MWTAKANLYLSHAPLHTLFKKRPAVTLFEMILTIALFSVVGTLAAGVLTNSLKSARKIQDQVFLYTEAQAAMDQVGRAIEHSAIDYEAYFSRQVLGENSWETPHYGYYAKSFYDPGAGGPDSVLGPYDGITGYGTSCANDINEIYPTDCPGEAPNTSTMDLNTGKHPFEGISNGHPQYLSLQEPRQMNAMCAPSPGGPQEECSMFHHQIQDELILINGEGDERTVFRLQNMDGQECDQTAGEECRLAQLQLLGTDGDGNGIIDTWVCSPLYDCPDASPTIADFKPIIPSSLQIQAFYMYISPMEDPYRAFGENEVQAQPQVTFLMTVGLNSARSYGLLGKSPTITLQRTVSTGVYHKIVSYEE